MDNKGSLLSRLMGKRRGCCCQVKIEEIPEGASGTPSDRSNQGQCCEAQDDTDQGSKP